jgi:hypothetical protein
MDLIANLEWAMERIYMCLLPSLPSSTVRLSPVLYALGARHWKSSISKQGFQRSYFRVTNFSMYELLRPFQTKYINNYKILRL